METPKRKIIDGVEHKLVGPVPGNRWYVPVHDRGHPDTAQTEMARLLDECAKLGIKNARLMKALGKADSILSGWGLGKKSPLRLEIADLLSNEAMRNGQEPSSESTTTTDAPGS